MYNFNDIQVEQEIAQERYQDIIRSRKIARALKQADRTDPHQRILNWIGQQLVSIGRSLQTQSRSAIDRCYPLLTKFF